MDELTIQEAAAKARTGDVRALATLGRCLLFGEGAASDPQRGILYLRQAAQGSDADAPALLAMLAALGVLEARDRDKALDLLRLGAERGSLAAQAQLRHLAQSEVSDWTALRSAAAACLAPRALRRALSDDPHLRLFEGFATPAECRWLIEKARAHLRRALIYQGTNDLRPSEVRTNTEADLAVNNCDVATAFILDRLAEAVGVSRAFCEVAKVLHYEPGQHFGLHGDFYQTTQPELREEIARCGQRIVTFLLYLNDDYEGGETDFPKIGVRYKAKMGDALMFANVDAAGAPDLATVHAGLPPTRGEKWVLSQWIRGKAVNGFMTPGGEAEKLDRDWRTRF